MTERVKQSRGQGARHAYHGKKRTATRSQKIWDLALQERRSRKWKEKGQNRRGSRKDGCPYLQKISSLYYHPGAEGGKSRNGKGE